MKLASCTKMAVCFMCYMVALSMATSDDAKQEHSLQTIRNETKELKTALAEMVGSSEQKKFDLKNLNLPKALIDGDTVYENDDDDFSKPTMNEASVRTLYDEKLPSLPFNSWPSKFHSQKVDRNSSSSNKTEEKKFEEVVSAANDNSFVKEEKKVKLKSSGDKNLNRNQQFGSKLNSGNEQKTSLGFSENKDDWPSYDYDNKNVNENPEVIWTYDDYSNSKLNGLRDELVRIDFDNGKFLPYDPVDPHPAMMKTTKCDQHCEFRKNNRRNFRRPFPKNNYRNGFSQFDVNSLPIHGPEHINDMSSVKDDNSLVDDGEFTINKRPEILEEEHATNPVDDKPNFNPTGYSDIPSFPPNSFIFPGTFPYPSIGVINGNGNPGRLPDAARVMNRSPMIMFQFLPPMPMRPMFYHPHPMYRPPQLMRSSSAEETEDDEKERGSSSTWRLNKKIRN